MARQTILRAVIWLLSTPFLLIARICWLCNLFDIRNDLKDCQGNLTKYAQQSISDELFTVLRLAEDHRNDLHFGIDPIAIQRAIWRICSRGSLEGGSTIEQQFVRASTGRFERTLFRKFREQMLAVSLRHLATKREIASAFIAIVYYGDQYKGPREILARLNREVRNAGFFEATLLVARIKYPEPFDVNSDWLRRFGTRVSYLLRLSEQNSEDGFSVVETLSIKY